MQTLLLDSNLLTLLVIGLVSEEQVPRCKRTKKYTADDFRLLADYLSQFENIVITPNIATETSNLIGVLHGKHLDKARQILARVLNTWNEHYIESISACNEENYLRLGLTDTAIILAAHRNLEVITDDLDLYLCLASKNIPTKNFTHMRSFNSRV